MENVHPLIFLVRRLHFNCPFPCSPFCCVSVERCKIHRPRLKVLRLEHCGWRQSHGEPQIGVDGVTEAREECREPQRPQEQGEQEGPDYQQWGPAASGPCRGNQNKGRDPRGWRLTTPHPQPSTPRKALLPQAQSEAWVLGRQRQLLVLHVSKGAESGEVPIPQRQGPRIQGLQRSPQRITGRMEEQWTGPGCPLQHSLVGGGGCLGKWLQDILSGSR